MLLPRDVVHGADYAVTRYNRKNSVYHTVNGDLHCFAHQKQQNDKGYIT